MRPRLPREGRSLRSQGRRSREGRRGEARSAQGARIPRSTQLFRQAIAHLIMGLGGEDDEDTKARIAAHEERTDRSPTRRSIDAIAAVLLHGGVQPQEPAGRSTDASPTACRVMAMAAHTGCNTVYGSTLAEQPASLSLDELALPGRHHRRLAHGRELHRRPRAAARSFPSASPTSS